MSVLSRNDHCEITIVDREAEDEGCVGSRKSVIKMVPEPCSGTQVSALKPDAGDFAKWLKENHPNIDVELPEADSLALHSSEIWLPLVILASDIGIPIYLNMVSSYLYERARGLIGNERPRVDLCVEYKEGESTKRLSFRGDADELKKLTEELGLKGYFSGTEK